jgi:hypothetical protein
VSYAELIYTSFPLLLFCPDKYGTGFDQKSNNPDSYRDKTMESPAILRDRLIHAHGLRRPGLPQFCGTGYCPPTHSMWFKLGLAAEAP